MPSGSSERTDTQDPAPSKDLLQMTGLLWAPQEAQGGVGSWTFILSETGKNEQKEH